MNSAIDTNLTINGSAANGSEATFSDSQSHKFNVACNQTTGYTITAYATDLTRLGSDNAIAFVNYDSYATSKSSNPDASIWSAQLINADAGATFGTSSSPNIIKNTSGITNIDGDEFSVNYMAYVGNATPSGTYSGQAVYILTTNPLPDTEWHIIYNTGAAGTNATNMPTTQSGTIGNSEDFIINLSDIIPNYAGYRFLGWDTNATATTAVYTAGEEVTISRYNPTLNLYAVWEIDTTMQNGNYMQAMTADSCANVQKYSVSGITYQLVDSRDDHSYLVRKLDDGNCWMVQNLSLEGGTVLSNTDSDLITISSYTLPASSQATSERWNSNTDEIGYMYNGTHQNATKNTMVTTNNVDTSNTGSYYSYVVATAGYDPTVESGEAPNSICPKGWKIPTGGDSGQFNSLYITSYSSNNTNLQEAMYVNEAYSGLCAGSGCPYPGSNIFLWTSTIKSDAHGYLFTAGWGGTYPTNSSNKYNGASVRCILRP